MIIRGRMVFRPRAAATLSRRMDAWVESVIADARSR